MSNSTKHIQPKVEAPTAIYTRRCFLKAGALIATGVTFSGCVENSIDLPVGSENAGGEQIHEPIGQLEPTLSCGEETASNAEGPFYTKDVPERSVLVEPGAKGIRLLVTGHVLSVACQPIAGALLDFWHADDDGEYDNVGFTFRGKQYTDVNGQYRLETVLPGLYPGRTRHIHVKASAPAGPVLTTQLYFENEPANQRDGLIQSSLLMPVVNQADDIRTATFDFILSI